MSWGIVPIHFIKQTKKPTGDSCRQVPFGRHRLTTCGSRSTQTTPTCPHLTPTPSSCPAYVYNLLSFFIPSLFRPTPVERNPKSEHFNNSLREIRSHTICIPFQNIRTLTFILIFVTRLKYGVCSSFALRCECRLARGKCCFYDFFIVTS